MRGSFLLEDAGEGEELPGFDIDSPVLPEDIERKAFRSGGYPYSKRLKKKHYEKELEDLQIELLKLLRWVERSGKRLVVVFEGRDAAGKDGCIKRFLAHLNPRHAWQVALSKPTDAELGQWYFQRYVAQLPTAGNMILFNRSWYNRAGVEPVMGYCTEEQYHRFMDAVPQFEAGLVQDGIILVKLWLSVGREMQLKRFHARRHDALKRWKLTDNDVRGLSLFNAYSAARDRMFARTDTDFAPWLVVRSNDKRRARLNVIRAVLYGLDYDGKDHEVADKPDPKIVGRGPEFFENA
ncbi:polyphosphate kinase 2 [Methyloligella solikamskensis]|uniref:ADP/GDP-polyphosphate phosphotransferase n=1 Tax=Methyloligella solikamskensis TaxID=1177756 RepID=A0ABW3JDN0_9HYPH